MRSKDEHGERSARPGAMGETSRPRPARASRRNLVALGAPLPTTTLRLSRERSERDIRAALGAGEVAGAASDVLRLYEAEVFGFLLAVLDDSAAARDVYLSVGERVGEDIAGFAWRCSLRAWVYAIAHQEMGRRPPRPEVTDAGDSPRSVALPDPTTTIPCRPIGMRASIAALRRQLPPEDRELLILRIDRRFGWRELAVTSIGERTSHDELVREGEPAPRPAPTGP